MWQNVMTTNSSKSLRARQQIAKERGVVNRQFVDEMNMTRLNYTSYILQDLHFSLYSFLLLDKNIADQRNRRVLATIIKSIGLTSEPYFIIRRYHIRWNHLPTISQRTSQQSVCCSHSMAMANLLNISVRLSGMGYAVNASKSPSLKEHFIDCVVIVSIHIAVAASNAGRYIHDTPLEAAELLWISYLGV